MSTLRNRVSDSDLKKYLSFFEFYYYVLKRSPKRYNISLNNSTLNYLSILMTPFVLWILSMIVFLFVGHGWATFLFTGLGAILVLNFIFTRNVLSQAYEIQRKLNEERREMEREERERQRKREEEKRKKGEEELRKERARKAFERFKEKEREDAKRRAEQHKNVGDNQIAQLFAVLGIKPTHDIEVIKKAFRKKVKDNHPDIKGGNDKTFMRVKDAYDMIRKLIESKAF